MNLSCIYYFRNIVEEGSYRKASEKYFVSPSTLSTAVNALEEELGCPLLLKKRMGVKLTPEGEEFYQAAVTATNAIERCKENLQQLALSNYSHIRVGMVYSIQSYEWSSMLRRSRSVLGKNTRFDLRQGTTELLIRELLAGNFDVVFTGTLPKVDSNVAMIPVYTQRAVLAVNKEHPLAERESVRLDELEGLNVVSYRQKEGPFVEELAALFKEHPHISLEQEYNDEITLGSVVVGNPDIVAISCYNWLMLAFDELKLVEIEDAPVDFHRFYMCYRKNERKSPILEKFIDFVKRQEFGNVSPPIPSSFAGAAENEGKASRAKERE